MSEAIKDGSEAAIAENEAGLQIEDLEARFSKLIAEEKIHVDPEDPTKYVIARFTRDKAEAVLMGERIDQLHAWDLLKSVCFVNGMIDGIQTYKREVSKLGPLKYEKALGVGNLLLNHIQKERLKMMS